MLNAVFIILCSFLGFFVVLFIIAIVARVYSKIKNYYFGYTNNYRIGKTYNGSLYNLSPIYHPKPEKSYDNDYYYTKDFYNSSKTLQQLNRAINALVLFLEKILYRVEKALTSYAYRSFSQRIYSSLETVISDAFFEVPLFLDFIIKHVIMAIYVSGINIFIAVLVVFFVLRIMIKQRLKARNESREHAGNLAEDQSIEAPCLEVQPQIAPKTEIIKHNIHEKTLESGLTKEKLDKRNEVWTKWRNTFKSSHLNEYPSRRYKSSPISNNIYIIHGYQQMPIKRPSFNNTLFSSRVQNFNNEYSIFNKKNVSLANCTQRKQTLRHSLKTENIKIGSEINLDRGKYLPKFNNSKTADQYCQMVSALKEGLPGKINEADETLNELVAPLPKRATRLEILKSRILTPIMAKIKSSRLEKLQLSELKRINGKRSDLEICLLKKKMFR
ncbi:hypothetical protein BB560_000982 [Smittium megazygosporum]|uniref:Uncharacterized protein n=1 Tax=Smittium megazygosporum TaxID=133381 RepID=A0A2T9ZIT7_9FUNG|nr:hypothetical protein BB560_000982 [Smittium megazygosporum]